MIVYQKSACQFRDFCQSIFTIHNGIMGGSSVSELIQEDSCWGLELVNMFCVSESFQKDHGGGHLPQQFLPSVQLQTAPSPSSSKQRFRNTPPFSKMLTIWTSSSEHIFKSLTLSSLPLVIKMQKVNHLLLYKSKSQIYIFSSFKEILKVFLPSDKIPQILMMGNLMKPGHRQRR